jgi:glycosyltransferase involved in cell wall biosynthesis
MRILIDATSRLNGGGLTFVQHLAEFAECWGHEVHFLFRAEKIAQFRANSNRVVFHKFGRFGSTLGEKLVWEQFYVPYFAQRIGAKLIFNPIGLPLLVNRIPLVCQFTNAAPFSPEMTHKLVGDYNWIYFRILGFAQRVAARVASKIIFVSEDYKRTFCKRFPLAAAKSIVIPHGRPISLPDADIPLQYSALIEENEPYLLCISHLYQYKLLETVIKAYHLGRSEFSRLNLRIIVLGAALDRQYALQLQQLIRTLELESQVLLLGSVPAEVLPAFIRKSEGLIFQSLCENCPNALIEGLAYGAAVICSRIGSTVEIAGNAAVMYDPRDPVDLRNKLLTVLEDESLRFRMRQRSLARAQELPTWSEVIKRYGAIFESVCAAN